MNPIEFILMSVVVLLLGALIFKGANNPAMNTPGYEIKQGVTQGYMRTAESMCGGPDRVKSFKMENRSGGDQPVVECK